MMTKEGSTKIVNFMTPGAGGRGGDMRWMVKITGMYNNFDDVHIAIVYSPVIMKLSSGIVALYLFYDRHVDVKI